MTVANVKYALSCSLVQYRPTDDTLYVIGVGVRFKL